MGKIILTCGHEDPIHPLGWDLFYKTEDGVISGSYCTKCYVEFIEENPNIVLTEYEFRDALEDWMLNDD
jgi:hypothetical protein